MKARPPTAVKGVPRWAMRRKASKPEGPRGPRGLGEVCMGTLSNSRYSIGAGEESGYKDLKSLKLGEKRKLKIASTGGLEGEGVGSPQTHKAQRRGPWWNGMGNMPPRMGAWQPGRLRYGATTKVLRRRINELRMGLRRDKRRVPCHGGPP